jgi:hypothetical protein
MYLSVKSCHILDGIVKDFEVALRSFIAFKLKILFCDEEKFKKGLLKIDESISTSTVLLSNQFKSQIKTSIKEYKIHYDALDASYKSYVSKDIINSNIPLLSKVISYVELFYDPHFKSSELVKGFETLEFLYYAHKFHKTRNVLSHPGGWKITIESKHSACHVQN